MTTRTIYTAVFFYPGAMFPEETQRTVERISAEGPTLADALAVQPTAADGTYFTKDGWYALNLLERTEVLCRSTEPGTEDQWVKTSSHRCGSWLVGTEFHVDEIPDDVLVVGGEAVVGGNLTLKANIRGNSREPKKDIGVLCRPGNWQIASDWNAVITHEEASNG